MNTFFKISHDNSGKRRWKTDKNKQTVCCEKVKDLETLRQLAEAKDTWHVNFYDIRISFFFMLHLYLLSAAG